MKVIELQPGDRVRLLVANNFSWRKNGAIEKFFRSHVQSEFFSHHFQDDDSVRIVKERRGTTMVLAIRHWFFEGFRHLER